MSRAWMAEPERGSALLMRLIAWIARRLGRRVARLLLFPISVYFLTCTSKARAASRAYLARVLCRPVRLRDSFHHFYWFACTVLDRVFLLSGRFEEFDIRMYGVEALTDQLDRGRGCILLGSHLGSFEVLRALGLQRDLPINVLMYEDNASKTNAVFKALNPAAAATVIPIGQPQSLLAVQERLQRGELVGLLGDRLASDDKATQCRFLGERAAFPTGPMLLASLLKAPVVLCFGLYRGGRRYDLHFELLAETVDIARTERESALHQWTQRYAERLEHHCRQAPYNWFNFYDFWAAASSNAAH